MTINRSSLMRGAALVAIVLVAVGVRAVFADRESLDYLAFLRPWYDHIDSHDGIFALKDRFADYNYPYLYLLAALTYLHIPPLIGIKAVSVVFDIVLAAFVHRIVAQRHPGFGAPTLAFAIVLFLPTVVLNSGWWGQADSIYSAFVVGGVYFLLRRRPWWACAFIGIAFAFKLQTVFILPLVAWLVLRRWIPWRSLLAIPAAMVILDIPALLVGAPIGAVVSVYTNQVGSYKSTTLGAANIYQLLPFTGDLDWLAYAGIGLTAVIGVAFLGWTLRARPDVTPRSIMAIATASVLLVPYLLPAMHDRYFYPAEVLTVAAAFFLPLAYVAVPIVVQLAGVGVYRETLDGPMVREITDFLTHHRGIRLGDRPGGHGGRPGGGGFGPRGFGKSEHYESGRGNGLLQTYAWMMTAAVLAQLGVTAWVLRHREPVPSVK
ncbi:glycosyltransferase 87 family protein [Williamsia maris]|uniref:Mannosyltransferase related to Gpi18 n=1 Tax=Williamsia maris TaxID=72806 RepID=A0ABT1H8Z5_9NOCA|nr:glycosyltransferase 87 family protein [Williamsia maris]MCP2174733.1 Mannosyltransferase related to Gpi18 [Williamsia maris]